MKFLLLLIVPMFIACEEPKVESEPVLRPVRFIEIGGAGADGNATSYTGVSRPASEANLSFRVAGTLEFIGFKLGDRVKKGQELARIDSSDLQLQAQQASDAYAQAKASQTAAEPEFNRVRKLYENNSASRSQYDSARSQLDQAKASVRSASRQLQLARKQVTYAKLLSPSDGVVSQVLAQQNEFVQPGQAIVGLASGGDIEIVINVPGSFVSNVKIGDQVKVNFRDIPDSDFEAIVQEVGVSPSAQQTTFPVIAVVQKKDEAIRAGMAVEVKFESVAPSKQTEGVWVPSHAIGEDSKSKYVFVLNSEGDKNITKRVEVTVDPELSEQGVLVTSGVKKGDRVVTAGVSRVIDGQEVALGQKD